MLEIAKTGINMISEEYKNSLRVLESGEVVYFKLLYGIPNNDPDLEARQKRPFLIGHRQLQTHFRIKDPKTGAHVEVGLVEDFAAETGFVTKWKTFVPNMHMPQCPDVFSLTGGNFDHEELYEILQMSHENKSNPNRDQKVEALFEEVKTPKINFDAIPKAKNKPQVVETAPA